MSELQQQLVDAVDILKADGLIGMPTETVYGLAGNAASAKAVAAIYALKNRPTFNPLIAHVASLEMAQREAVFSETALSLADAFWPGPMTLVLPVASQNTVCDLARAGLDTQALRWPEHPIAQGLISSFGGPLVAPSANKSGRISPTRQKHVLEEFGADLKLVLDGGQSVLGLESTVLFVDDDKVTQLRAGSLAREAIEALVGPISSALDDDEAPRSPGMLSRHYAPEARLRLNVDQPESGEAYLGFGDCRSAPTLNLSEAGSLSEAASNLYDMLRRLDQRFDKIAVAPIPETGIGQAINDRLRRASL